MLELRNVSKLYSGIPAVTDVSFIARPGEVTGYLGPNGSGKSTTLKMITGLIEPSERRDPLRGQAHSARPDSLTANASATFRKNRTSIRISPAPSISRWWANCAACPAKRSSRKIDGFLRLLSLHGDRYVPISSYSKGMRQKMLLAAALLHNPDLVLLDEPFSGLDVNSALVLRDLIRELAARGKTVLFSSHELDTVERVSSRVVILHKGQSRRERLHRAPARAHVAADAGRNLLAVGDRTEPRRHHHSNRRPHRSLVE